MNPTTDLSRYSRQTVYAKIGRKGQEKLLASRVVIAGVGALGTVIADHLCRTGVGYIRLIDRDTVELSNLQRQLLFDEEDARRQSPKAAAAAEHLQKINSGITLEPAVTELNASNIEQLCSGTDLILDGSDNMELRQLINEYCVKNNRPWIYGGALMAAGVSMNIFPGETPCLRCLYPELPAAGSYPTCGTVGVINMITSLIASVESAEAVKILTGSPDVRKDLFMADLWDTSMEYMEVQRNPRCPVCGEHRYELLGKPPAAYTSSLCGRDAVQVVPGAPASLDFAALAEKLRNAGTVEYSRFMLSFDDGRTGFQLFPDGRAIIHHTQDENAAKSVYSEFIGF